MKTILGYFAFVLFGASVLTLVSCADYGSPGYNAPRDGSVDSGSDVIDGSATCPVVDAATCEECEECPEVVECDSCCPECPEPPTQDPCDCFSLYTNSYDRQVCLTDMVRAQGLCTKTPGQHYDVKFYCKINGSWKYEKTWVYPCDETPWYER